MRRWLPRRLTGIALMPRWLVSVPVGGAPAGAAVDAPAGALAGYRLRLRWNGRHELRAASVPRGEPCIVVLDGALPLRRKLQRFPATPKARLALLRTAPEEFPLPAEELLYGLGLRGEDAYLYALPRSVLTDLVAQGPRPAVILVAEAAPAPAARAAPATPGSAAGPAACLAAFESFLRAGASLDLLRERRYLSRRTLLRAQLAAALGVAVLAGAALLLRPEFPARILEWRVAELREKGSALPKMYRITEEMASAQAAAAELQASREARLPAVLAALFNGMPPQSSLRSIEFKNGVLRITGTGSGVQSWLTTNGFAPERIVEQQAGALRQFSAERPL